MHAPEPGQYLDIGGQVPCFSPAEDSIGCLRHVDGQEFELAGPRYRAFGAEELGEFFATGDGVTQLPAPHVRIDFDNGGRVLCHLQEPTFSCGDARELDRGTADDGATPAAAVFLDVSGTQPVVEGTNASNVGGATHTRFQPAGPGRHLVAGMLLDHDGTTATFPLDGGGSFWVGTDGFGVN